MKQTGAANSSWVYKKVEGGLGIRTRGKKAGSAYPRNVFRNFMRPLRMPGTW